MSGFIPINVDGDIIRIKFGSKISIVASGTILRRLLDIQCPTKREKVRAGNRSYTVQAFRVDALNAESIIQAIPSLHDLLSSVLPNRPPETKNWIWKEPNLDDRLFTYQRKGVEWLIKNRGGYLADEMGLGKTIQALQFLENSPYT